MGEAGGEVAMNRQCDFTQGNKFKLDVDKSTSLVIDELILRAVDSLSVNSLFSLV